MRFSLRELRPQTDPHPCNKPHLGTSADDGQSEVYDRVSAGPSACSDNKDIAARAGVRGACRRQHSPRRAMTQTNLGLALVSLGERTHARSKLSCRPARSISDAISRIVCATRRTTRGEMRALGLLRPTSRFP
jgi:hypothetical protein